MLPWATNGLPGDDSDKQASQAPQLAQQPLTGLGGGETIREVHQDTPFSMVALTADDLTGTSAKVRAKKSDGSWGPWYEAETLDGVGPDSAVPRGTEPIFVGRTTTVQISVTRPAGTAPTAAPPKAPAKPGLGYVPANVEQPFAQNINAVLISPPQAPVDTLPLPSAVTVPGQPPNIIGRAQWGADEAMRCGNTVYDNGIRAAVVHHTAGSNDYAPQDSAGIVRSIYEYHTRTLGWCDIAYNALVDKYGQVFEGRAGGMDKPVEGSHTGGFNRNTWGVAMMGDFDVVPADTDSVADHGPPDRLAARHRPPRSAGHGRIALGGWVVHQVPDRRDADAADDLHPPRRRQHRLPGQRRVCGDGADPRHRGAVQRPARARGSGRTRCAAGRSLHDGSRSAE